MSEPNKEFLELIKSISNNETFDLTLTDGNNYKFKQLSTVQLKELIKTVIDSPITQNVFGATSSRILGECLVGEKRIVNQLNVVDRILFIIETRIRSISPTLTLKSEDDTKTEVDLNNILQKIIDVINANKSDFEDQTIDLEKMRITFGVPTLGTDRQLNDQLAKNTNINPNNQDADQIRDVLGEAFINEICKTIKTIQIEDKVLDFSTLNFKTRLSTTESLPAFAIQSVIDYIEKYKGLIDSCLEVTKQQSITLDGSLFSIR